MQDKTNFLIDFETLDTRPKAVVRCLSIIPFTLAAEESVEALLARSLTVWFEPGPQIEAGRTVDEDTLDFWNQQLQKSVGAAHANAEAILGTHPEDVHPKMAIEIIAAYLHDVAPNGLIYSRGSNFDFPIFESLCEDFSVALPYSTWKAACSKSILRFMCNDDKNLEAGLVSGLKSNHTSSFDCAVEAKKLQALYAALNSD